MNHTPGPWEYRSDGEAANHFSIVKPQGGFNGDAIIARLRCEGNAQLIAAAPDLLAAVRSFLEADTAPMGSGDRELNLHRARAEARAALKKAGV
jgi:hypothetical protein